MWITGHKIDKEIGKNWWNLSMGIVGAVFAIGLFCYWLFEMVLGG